MPPPPKRKPTGPASPRDRTSAVVAIGLGVLAVTGVATIFSEPLFALVAPPAPDHGTASAEPAHAAPSAGPTDGGVDS
jgi:hypothetical protein